MKPGWCFLIFWNFFLYFWEFSISVLVKTVPSKKFVFLFFGQAPPVSAWNDATMFFFLIFCIFLGILKIRMAKNGSEREESFLSFSAYPNLFRLEMKPSHFLNFFSIFFGNYFARVGKKRFRTKFFFFPLFQSVPTRFGLKLCQDYVFNYFTFFANFFGILLLGSGKNGSERDKNGPYLFRLEMKTGWFFFFF